MPDCALPFSFRATSPRVGELVVPSRQPGARLALYCPPRFGEGEHSFGVEGRPRYRMEQPLSPDDAWSVSVDLRGKLANALPPLERGEADEAIEAWLGHRLKDRSRRLLGALPEGRYALVQVARPAHVADRILLGNESVEMPPNALEIGYAPPFYAAVFGAFLHTQPALGNLLVAIVLLQYTGHSTLDGAWLFDLAGSDAVPHSTGEMLVVVPLESPLVIDALYHYDTDSTATARARWVAERGPAFLKWLADEDDWGWSRVKR